MNIRNTIHRLLSRLVPAKAPAPAPASISLDDAILNSKRQLLEIFDGITDPILMVDRSLRILRLNRTMLALLDGSNLPAGKAGTYNDFIGRYCYEVLHEKQNICVQCPIAELFTEGTPPSQRLFEFARGGERRKFNVSVFPLKGDNGKIYAAVKYFKDITYLAQLEVELYDAEKSRVLGSLALGLAHEIRNPLAIISSIAQYLQKDCGDDADTRENMETIIRNAETANNVIADLLNFARPKEKKIEIAGLEGVLDGGLRLLKDKLSAQKIQVEKKYDKTLPKVWLDKSIFTQAFVNIILNAIDAMPVGGTITIETKGEDGQARIAVSDTGKGYPPEVMDRLLKPFFRSKGGPVDLRLPIAEDIIKSHGGSVELHNNEKVGATTTIRIPLMARGLQEKKD